MDKLPYYCHSFVLQASFKTSRAESKNSLTNHEIRQGVFLFSQGELGRWGQCDELFMPAFRPVSIGTNISWIICEWRKFFVNLLHKLMQTEIVYEIPDWNSEF